MESGIVSFFFKIKQKEKRLARMEKNPAFYCAIAEN
jgi:hypothetical protein